MVEFDQMWFILLHSLICGVHTSSIGVAALGYDFIIFPMILLPSQVCFHVGEQKIWRVINQLKATITHSSHCKHRLCAGALSWWNWTPFISFPDHLRNVSRTTFQSPELLIQCGFTCIWKETMQSVSGNVEFNACHVSLLWHNSFLVSLWTFQPILVH